MHVISYSSETCVSGYKPCALLPRTPGEISKLTRIDWNISRRSLTTGYTILRSAKNKHESPIPDTSRVKGIDWATKDRITPLTSFAIPCTCRPAGEAPHNGPTISGGLTLRDIS